MDVTKEIKKIIRKTEQQNKSRTDAYKKKLKEEIRVNLLEKKQSVEKNQHLIDRYYRAKPQTLTAMQQALLEATK